MKRKYEQKKVKTSLADAIREDVLVAKTTVNRNANDNGDSQTKSDPPSVETWTEADDKGLSQCEASISKGLITFFEVGEALAKISENRWYRKTHPNFDAYCKERWGFTDAHARRQMDAFKVVADLTPIGAELIPKNEGQVRILGRVDSSKRKDVMVAAKVMANGGRMTGKHIAQAAKEVTEQVNVDVEDSQAAVEGGGSPARFAQSKSPIRLEQIIAWVEEVSDNMSAGVNQDESLERLEDIKMALDLMLSNEAVAV